MKDLANKTLELRNKIERKKEKHKEQTKIYYYIKNKLRAEFDAKSLIEAKKALDAEEIQIDKLELELEGYELDLDEAGQV